ncbi:MAG: hypothetical protein P4L46_12975 [Fimbriimonas sp.]|nr:hypothetical protein [Fimbriimonas sp.]
METRKSKWLIPLAIVSSLLFSACASAQLSVYAENWHTFKGGSSRQGHNGDPHGSGPGQSNLRWWSPGDVTNQLTTNLIVDNTYGLGANTSGLFQTTSAWVVSPSSDGNTNDQDAANPYLVLNGAGNYAVPSYIFTNVIPSTSQSDPTQGGAGLTKAIWTFTTPTTTPGNYGLYVWLPNGPQVFSNVEGFPQRYYVYQISAGGRTYTDVVDTYLTGGGWVRLGNGGNPTNMVFPFDGVNNITITLFNTDPLKSDGTVSTTLPSPNATNVANNIVVYADAAMAVPLTGYYDASPVSAQLTPGTAATAYTIAAGNQLSSGGTSTSLSTVVTGNVTSYNYALGTPNWNYTPPQSGNLPYTTDNTTAAVTGGFTNNLTATRYSGAYVSEATIPVGGVATDSVTYSGASLGQGTYQIYAYLPGNNNGQTYGQSVLYQVIEGSSITNWYVNQAVGGGWVQIGTRRFNHIPTTAILKVRVTNGSNNIPGDQNSTVYANAIRFVGEGQTQSFSSTPVIATVPILQTDKSTYKMTQVVVVSDEAGYIHCLDATGNGDGTTTEYWSYPSTLGTNGTDPNQVAGKDLGAEMPSGFGLSSALVEPMPSVSTNAYYLYIATSNGRVYCIDMAGNGDFGDAVNNAQKSAIGTTNRIWTYPSTAPSASAIANSKLGAFQGSLAYGAPMVGGVSVPTIYAPTLQGRMYALDAVGKSDKSTNVLWAFPKTTQPTLGPIITTPAFYNTSTTGSTSGPFYLYFGTCVNTTNETGGVFYCLNASNYSNGTAPAIWSFSGDSTSYTPLNYSSGPAVVRDTNATAGGVLATDGLVYAVNQNNYVYALDALNGAVQFETNELNVGAIGSVSYTWQTVYDNNGIPNPFPTILIPTLDGRFDSLFADPVMANQYGIGTPFNGSRRAWEFVTPSETVKSTMAVSNNWMYGADQNGFFYAFNDGSGYITQGNPPGGQTITENNPAGAIFRHAQIKLVNQKGYNLLRQPTGSNLDYYSAISAAYSFSRTPLAFEWGETAYILVYNFPYLTTNGASTVAPPVVNITFSAQGKTIRTITAEARLFTEPPNAPDDQADPNYPNGIERDNGYAVLSYTFASGLNQSLPPGPGNISISISSSALNTNNVQQNIALNPKLANNPFLMANPIAISMNGPDTNGNFTDLVSMGLSVSPSNAENLVNGSPKLPGTTKLENLLGAATNVAQHGSSQTVPIWVIDRSMMGLQRPDDTGLDNVRLTLNNLGWQGGDLAIYKKLPLPYYANFEDYPDNYPNDSFDYPDLQSEQVQVTKDPNGTAENPRFNSVSLLPPMVLDPNTGKLRQMELGDDPSWRKLVGTQFAMTINVPRFQPPNTNAQVSTAGALVSNSAGSFLNQGYLGRVEVFVDSNGNGVLDGSPGETYRGFNLSTSVDVDEKIAITTPTIDLGTLPAGAGYSPLRPGTTNSPFSPWGGPDKGMFQPFVVENRGNVNLLNLRVAKGANLNGYNPWGFFSPLNDSLGFLDGSVDLWSDIDTTFAPSGTSSATPYPVALQKARITSVAPSQLSVNPVRLANANLGTNGTSPTLGAGFPDVLNTLVSGGSLVFPPGPPHIGVSVPLGMPVGPYSNTVEVFEQEFQPGNEIWQLFNNGYGTGPEPASDPTLTVNFKVRETQLTSSFTNYAAPMLDSLALPNGTAPFAYSNKQPTMVRDSYGSLLVAFASDRPNWAPTQPTASTQLGNFSLFIGTVGNGATFGSGGISNTVDAQSSLSDLNSFQPSTNTQWFNKAVGNYPNVAPDVLFGSLSGESVVAGTVQFGNPTFPTSGVKNPFNPTGTFGGLLMAFTGDAQKQTPNGRIGQSQLFMSVVTPSGGGSVSIAPPVAMTSDPQIEKGKPSLVQTLNGAMVFYTGAGGSQSNIFYTTYGNAGSGSAGFGPSLVLPFGSAFKWVASPSAVGRVYNGAGEFIPGTATQTLAAGNDVVELTFAGQLQGRSIPEIFYGRMKVDSGALVVVDDQGVPANSAGSDGNVFMDLSPIAGERLIASGQPGTYRALGIDWDRNASIVLSQTLNGVTTNLLIPGTAVYDQTSGTITFDCRLGGKVYIDPRLGTVRFPNAAPNGAAVLFASYTPRFLRISAGSTQGYAKPTGLFDARQTTNVGYWRLANGQQADFSVSIPNDRYVFTYNQAAGGAGRPPRPYISTLRFGVQLPASIATTANGAPVFVSVTGAKGPYQIDPANGRIYFTDADEDNQVSIKYTAVLATGSTGNLSYQGVPVTWIREELEQQILIDNAVNESDLSAFLDPFSFISQRRPPLIWLFWGSSRTGVSDIYFETIAPNWNPTTITQ